MSHEQLLAMIDVQVSEQGNRVEVRTIVPRPRNFPGAVDYTITVPADARVSVRTTSGTIRTTSVVVDTLKVVSGDIEVTDGSADFFSAVIGERQHCRATTERRCMQTEYGQRQRDPRHRSCRTRVARAIRATFIIPVSSRLAALRVVSHAGKHRVSAADDDRVSTAGEHFSGSVRSDFAVTRAAGRMPKSLPSASPRALRGAFGDAAPC
jgi:uncharacterized protein YaiE (UPF0345 family)